MPSLTLIVAATLTNGIGQGVRLPWRIPHDMAYFAHVTTHAPEGTANAVIMGRKTWESIPKKYRPLKQRINVVVSGNPSYQVQSSQSQAIADQNLTNVSLQSSLQDAILYTLNPASNAACPLQRIFVIGGASIYKTALDLAPSSDEETKMTIADRILMTRILSPAFKDCDVFFPEFREAKTTDGSPLWTQASHEEFEAWVGNAVPRGTQNENNIAYEFQMWTRKE